MRPSHPRCESPSRLRSVLILATWASCIVCSSSTVHLGASFCNLCHPFIHGLLRCPHLRGDTHTLHRRHCQGHYSFRLLDDLMTVHHLLLVISCSPRGCYSFSFYAQIQTPWQECDSTTQAFQVLCSRSFDDTVRWFRGSRVRELHAFSFEIGSMEMWCLDMFGYVWWILQKIPSCFVVRCCFEVTNERPRCVLCKGKWHFFFAMFANMSLIDAFHILSWRMCLWRHANVHRMTGPQLVAILTK